MWFIKVAPFLIISGWCFVNCELYQKLRPMNDMSFIIHSAKITFQLRFREDLRYSVHIELKAQAVDGSISHIPLRAPHFFARYAFIEVVAQDLAGKESWQRYFPKQVPFSNLIVLDYEDQFFPQRPILIDLKGTKILNQGGQVGFQERFYWDKATQREEFYLFTNMFPGHVAEAIPFVNDWRTNIDLQVAIPSSMNHSVITPGTEVDGHFIFNKTCLSDMTFVVVNSMRTLNYTSYDVSALKFSSKTAHNNSFPVSVRDFEAASLKFFPRFQRFLQLPFSSVAEGVHLVTLPALNVRPSVLGSEMCLFDQDWIVTQKHNFGFYLAQCFVHQYFGATLLPYSPPIRFISDGLFAYYTMLKLESVEEGEDRALIAFNQVLVDEEREDTSRMLFRGYLEEYHSDQRSANKGAYLMHMMRSHFENPVKFDLIINDFMDSSRHSSFSYSDFTFAFWNKTQQMSLGSYERFITFFNSWAGSTGYPIIIVDVQAGHMKITSTLTENAAAGTKIHFPVQLFSMDRRGVGKMRVLWLATDEGIAIPYDETLYPLYFLNPHRDTPARVFYPVGHWEKFWQESKWIPVKIRVVLLNDAFYFYDRGYLDYNIMFQFFRWLKGEQRPHVWIAMEPVLMEMHRRWIFTDLHAPFMEMIRDFVKPFYLSRAVHNSRLAIHFGCWSQLPECLEDAEREVLEFISGPRIAIKMHLDTTICAGMRKIPTEIYQHLIELAKRISAKRDILLMGMCCIEREYDVELLMRSIFTRNEFNITTDMKYMLLLNTFTSSATGAEVAWRFIDRSHELLFRLFGRARFQELANFLAEYLKNKSQYRALKLVFQKFDLYTGNVFKVMLENRLKVERDIADKYEYLTKILLDNAPL